MLKIGPRGQGWKTGDGMAGLSRNEWVHNKTGGMDGVYIQSTTLDCY